MDPFDRFAQDEISYNTLREHGPRLAQEAAALLRQNREAELVELAGLIALPDAPEWLVLRNMAAQTSAEVEQLRGPFIGIVPRELMTHLGGAEFQSFSAEHAPMFSGMLPVMITTKDGARCAAFEVSTDASAEE